MLYQNKPADLKISFRADEYEKIEELFELKEGEQPLLHLMLALMGYKSGKKVDLETKDPHSDKTHEFSLRTVYNRNSTDMDASYGLISILDNLDSSYEEVINSIAFERTAINDRPFLKMQNVRTFYEYMLSGIEYFEINFMSSGKDFERISSEIHDFLLSDQTDINDILVGLLLEEKEEIE